MAHKKHRKTHHKKSHARKSHGRSTRRCRNAKGHFKKC
jgi:hypothetical protein